MYLNLDYDLLEWHLLQPKVLLLLNIYARMCSAQSCPQTMPIIQHHESTAKHQNSTWKCTLAKNCTRIIHMYQLQNIKTFLRVKMYFGKKKWLTEPFFAYQFKSWFENAYNLKKRAIWRKQNWFGDEKFAERDKL